MEVLWAADAFCAGGRGLPNGRMAFLPPARDLPVADHEIGLGCQSFSIQLGAAQLMLTSNDVNHYQILTSTHNLKLVSL